MKFNELEIDVDELMQKIREDIANYSDSPISDLSKNYQVVAVNSPVIVSGDRFESLLKNAEFYSQVPTKFPDKLNYLPKGLQKFLLKLYGFLLKKQRVVNSSLIQVLRETLVLNRGLNEQVNAYQEQLRATQEQLRVTQEQLRVTQEQLRVTQEQLGVTQEQLGVTQEQLKAASDRVTATEQNLVGIREHLSTADERYIRNNSYLKNDLAQQKRLIALFLEEARQRLPEPFSQEQIKTLVNEDKYGLDALYVEIEDRFRGSRADIINRLKVYLPLLEEAKINTQSNLILDIGCGRGEWIELLSESGYKARGLDLNQVMVEQCQARGFDVVQGDVISYLQSLPDASLSVVTGFHIIEHLPFKVLLQLFDETVRVLQPNGLVIFETPNPQNVLVGSNTFYLDPTHRNPLPSALIQAIAEIRGLYRVRIMHLNPYPEAVKLQGSELAERFNSYFYEAQDYALVGYKA